MENNRKKSPLSKREKQVLVLICSEKTTFEIAKSLKISDRTVDTHKTNIYRKTKAKSIIGLYKYSLKKRIVKVPKIENGK